CVAVAAEPIHDQPNPNKPDRPIHQLGEQYLVRKRARENEGAEEGSANEMREQRPARSSMAKALVLEKLLGGLDLHGMSLGASELKNFGASDPLLDKIGANIWPGKFIRASLPPGLSQAQAKVQRKRTNAECSRNRTFPTGSLKPE